MASADGSGAPAATDQEDQTAGILAWAARPRPLPLHCGVQHYAWGDPGFIPDLLGLPNTDATPHAELWIGAHPDLPAAVDLDPDHRLPLDRLIASAPEAVLGDAAKATFGAELPFLLKVLAAARPLSIQVHPNRSEARQGFAHEEGLGIPVDDPRRNYRDRNHKPELLVALTDFHALRGFRPLPEIAAELAHYPALAGLTADLDGTAAGLRQLYADFMRLPQPDVNALLAPVLAQSRRRADDRSDPGRTRCRLMLHADRLFSAGGHHDRGLLSFLLLNLLHLRPGQAMFLPAGELHSYLAGVGLELMANSNNVLRGGLTNKHIDVDALLEVLHVDPHAPEIIDPKPCTGDHERTRYETPAAEFALERLRLPAGARHALRPGAVTLGLVLRGAATITGGGATLRLGPGGCLLLPADVELDIRAEAGPDAGVDMALATVPTGADTT
jgi:mannose-6-phosphate isomerase class I